MGCVQSSEQAGDRSNLTRAVDPRLPFENYRQLYNLKNSWKAIARKLEDMAKSNLLRYSKFLYNLKNSWKAIARKLEDMAKSNLLRYSKFLATRRAIL